MKNLKLVILSLVFICCFLFLYWMQQKKNWKDASPANYVIKIVCYKSHVFALTQDDLYRSDNNGNSWQQITINLEIPGRRQLYSMDVDLDHIYIACNYGIIVSNNLDGNFTWLFKWGWDPCVDIDIQDGFGVAGIASWGSYSGLIKKTPFTEWNQCNGDIPYCDISIRSVAIDPVDPDKIFFAEDYFTQNGGEHYDKLANYPTILQYAMYKGKPTVFTKYEYSDDHCQTWKNYGINQIQTVCVGPNNLLYIYAYIYNYAHRYKRRGHDQGVYVGNPGDWTYIGLKDYSVRSIAANDDYIFAIIENLDHLNPDYTLKAPIKNNLLRRKAIK